MFLTLIMIINVSWAANKYIRMISKESWDAEVWSKNAENVTLPSKEKCTFYIQKFWMSSFFKKKLILLFSKDVLN